MGDLLSPALLRALSDKLYEKRKTAAIEVEQTVKNLRAAGNEDRLQALVKLLVDDYALSPQANYRKGGMIGLAAVTVGIAPDVDKLPEYLERIMPPVLQSFTDQDSRVRYYACESLYNIARASRESFILFFTDVFDALCKLSADADPNVQNAAHLLDRLVKDIVAESPKFDIETFIPMLRERLTALNPYVRQFLVGWITVLDSVPDIDMVEFLPDFLDGLLNMLSDSNREIRQQADQALADFLQEIKMANTVDYGRLCQSLVAQAGSSDEFTRLTAITWIHEFVGLAKGQLLPYFAEILGAILPCISHKEDRIREMALRANKDILNLNTTGESFDVPAAVAVVCEASSNGQASTRCEALNWASELLKRNRNALSDSIEELKAASLAAVSDESEAVVERALGVLAVIASDKTQLRVLMRELLEKFRGDAGRDLISKRGSFIVRRLAVLLGAEYTYREIAAILEEEADLMFAFDMVQVLNLILLTSAELSDLRFLLQSSLVSTEGCSLFVALYKCWSHNPVSAICLCFLAQAYKHSAELVTNFTEADITPVMLCQMDRLVQLLESPIFVYLRLQLLRPEKYPSLLESLYGILMLLPQTQAFETLRKRLHAAPTQLLSSGNVTNSEVRKTKNVNLNFDDLRKHFDEKQVSGG